MPEKDNAMKRTVIAGALMLPMILPAHSKTLVVEAGDRVLVEYVRDPSCDDVLPPNAATIKSWLAAPLKHGKLEIAPPSMHRSKRCGRKMWMRRVFYRATSKGTETINIQFPRNGLTTWQVQVH